MFRPIRRKKNEISIEAAKALLASERRGVLAMNGDDGYPYAIPLDYYYCESENKIYFHGAREGCKAEILKKDGKVCFTVFGNEKLEEGEWAPCVQSAVVFGKCTLIQDQERAVALVRRLAEKYYPSRDLIDAEVAASGKVLQMFEIGIEHISGKQIREK